MTDPLKTETSEERGHPENDRRTLKKSPKYDNMSVFNESYEEKILELSFNFFVSQLCALSNSSSLFFPLFKPNLPRL